MAITSLEKIFLKKHDQNMERAPPTRKTRHDATNNGWVSIFLGYTNVPISRPRINVTINSQIKRRVRVFCKRFPSFYLNMSVKCETRGDIDVRWNPLIFLSIFFVSKRLFLLFSMKDETIFFFFLFSFSLTHARLICRSRKRERKQ